MNIDDMIGEGEAIAKRCFLLSTEPHGEVVGYWGGIRCDIPNSLSPRVTRFSSRRHVVTVSEGLLDELDFDELGATSLFEWERTEGGSHVSVERDPRISFDSFTCDGHPLYATASRSFPPFEALCLHGSIAIAEWLASQGLRRYEYWKVAPDSISGYEAYYRQQLPLVQSSADVVVGGWHPMWPEDHYYPPAELTHILLTLRDAEPWYSVWYSPICQGAFAREHAS